MNTYCEFHDSTDLPPTRSYQINNCGLQRAGQYGYTIFRPKGRKDYHILYIQQGWITAELDSDAVQINGGNCVFYPPNSRQLYDFRAEGKAVSYWIHFTGTDIENALSGFPLEHAVCLSISERTQFESLFHRLSQIHSIRAPGHLLDENGLLLQLLAILTRSFHQQNDSGRSNILAAAAYIGEHYCEQICLDDCASQLHLSASRFSHLFKEITGISPYQYLLKLRMDKARELLLDSTLDVWAIAHTVGFDDASYFSRLFRRHTGNSPLFFRRQRSGADEKQP